MAGWFDANLVSILNGFAIGSLLFILAVGLSIVFGMMDVLNLAHGAFFLIGSYMAVTFVAGESWGGFLTALGVAALVGLLAGGALSVLTEPLARRPILDQALLTLGISLIVAETLSIIYGNDVFSVSAPPGLAGSVEVAGSAYPTYRLMLIGVGLVLALRRLARGREDLDRRAGACQRRRPRDGLGDGHRQPEGEVRRPRRRLAAGDRGRRPGGPRVRRPAGAGQDDPASSRSSSS